MCKDLKVSPSGYYDWSGRTPSARCQANAQLLGKIEAIHAMNDATYGMPRIRAELADQGIVASRKRIASLMRAPPTFEGSAAAVATW
jgi:putative transposase